MACVSKYLTIQFNQDIIIFIAQILHVHYTFPPPLFGAIVNGILLFKKYQLIFLHCQCTEVS